MAQLINRNAALRGGMKEREMKTQYQVTFVKNGYVVNRSIQTASSEKEAVSLARKYHAVGTAKGRAIQVKNLECE